MVDGKTYWYGPNCWTEGFATLRLEGTVRWLYLMLQKAELRPTVTYGQHLERYLGSPHFDLWITWGENQNVPPHMPITVVT